MHREQELSLAVEVIHARPVSPEPLHRDGTPLPPSLPPLTLQPQTTARPPSPHMHSGCWDGWRQGPFRVRAPVPPPRPPRGRQHRPHTQGQRTPKASGHPSLCWKKSESTTNKKGRALLGGTAEMINGSSVRSNTTAAPGSRPEIYGPVTRPQRSISCLSLMGIFYPVSSLRMFFPPPTRRASTGSVCLFPTEIYEHPKSKQLCSISLLLRHPWEQGPLLTGPGPLRGKRQGVGRGPPAPGCLENPSETYNGVCVHVCTRVRARDTQMWDPG